MSFCLFDNISSFENLFDKFQNYFKEISSPELNEFDFYTIDKFEGEDNIFAVCENRRTGNIVNIPISQICPNAKVNDIIKYTNGLYVVDEIQTLSISQKMENLTKDIFNK